MDVNDENNFIPRRCCRKHLEEDSKVPLWKLQFSLPFFMTCAVCGNKRCPKATDCQLDCTNSNEPGQAGSFYGGARTGEQRLY